MAFTPRTWVDRQVQYPTRRKYTQISGDVYDVSRAEGNISAEGDMFNASNMNDLEQRISGGFDTKADKEDTGWITVNSFVKYRAKNGIMCISLLSAGDFTIPAKQWTSITDQIPAKYLPNFLFEGVGVNWNSGELIRIRADSNGVRVYYISTTGYWGGYLTFPYGD